MSAIKVSRGCLGQEELESVRSAFEYGYFGHAFLVTEFEKKLGSYLGAEHVIATNTGSSALHLALDALGMGPGDEVLLPSLTFVACYQAVKATGAEPVACDVDADTLSISIEDVQRKITPKTKAVMPVHYGGNPCDMDALLRLKRRHGIRIVEDAAHALGSVYKGKKIGGFGDVACFSFDSIKNITCGEGGAIVVRSRGLAEKIRQKRILGIDRKAHASMAWKERTPFFEVRTRGFRYHMSNINAAIGLAQLEKLDGYIARRRAICRHYDSELGKISGIRLLRLDYSTIAPHIYVIRVLRGRRDSLMKYLKDNDIETGINYVPNHLHPYFRRKGVRLPETEKVYQEILTLPLHCALSDRDLERVISTIAEFFSQPALRN